MNNKDEKVVFFNFWFFFIIAIFLLVIDTLQISLSNDISLHISKVFLLESYLQTLLEVSFICIIALCIKGRVASKIYHLFIAGCFLFLLIHCIDFILIRFMSLSFWSALSVVLDETFDNFLEQLYLIGIPLQVWFLVLFPIALAIPCIGIIIYKWLQQLSFPGKNRFHVKKIGFFAGSSLLILVIIEVYVMSGVSMDKMESYQTLLPWKKTYFGTKYPSLQSSFSFSPLRNEKNLKNQIEDLTFSIENKPNIYLFIAESLRKDFITPENAPHLARFASENISLPETYSNANATHKSWYSIMHSNESLYWAEYGMQGNTEGSIPLSLLKKMGYQIHVHSGSMLKYYHLDEIMFGENHKLLDSFTDFPHSDVKNAHRSDAQTIDHLMQNITEASGQVHIVFLDSTHFNYSWPSDYEVPYIEINAPSAHLRMFDEKKGIESIKNRYRNSIHYVDSLFGKFLMSLKKKNLYEDSIIVVTGDHGEEFYEEGNLFHASNLSDMQITPPIFYKLGDNKTFNNLSNKPEMSSHIDIFPTILDVVLQDDNLDAPTFFDGTSILSKFHRNVVISGKFNGSRAPVEFALRTKRERVLYRMKSTSLQNPHLRIISVKNLETGEYLSRETLQKDIDIYQLLLEDSASQNINNK